MKSTDCKTTIMENYKKKMKKAILLLGALLLTLLLVVCYCVEENTNLPVRDNIEKVVVEEGRNLPTRPKKPVPLNECPLNLKPFSKQYTVPLHHF